MRLSIVAKFTLASLILSTLVATAFIPLGSPPASEHLKIGFVLGSLFGHAILAAAWVVLGPGGIKLRLPLAILWAVSEPLAFVINGAIYNDQTGAGVVYFSQFATIAIVLVISGCIRIFAGRRIHWVPRSERSAPFLSDGPAGRVKQYGIQDLMILTTVIAVAVSVGRFALGRFILPLIRGGEIAIFCFLVVAACLTCIPVLFAILGMKKLTIPLGILLIFVALVTYSELPLLNALGTAKGPDWLHILLINIFTLSPVVLVAIVLRSESYQFCRLPIPCDPCDAEDFPTMPKGLPPSEKC